MLRTEDSVQQIMAAQADRPTPVQVSAVQQKTMPIFLTALGTVTAYNTVTIKCARGWAADAGAGTRGADGASRDSCWPRSIRSPYQAALEQAQGQLVKDQANAVNAQAEAARYSALLQAGVVSKESQQAQAIDCGAGGGFDRCR